MKNAVIFLSLVIFSILNTTNLFALNNEWHGKAEGRMFTFSFNKNEKNFYINQDQVIKLAGNTATDIHIKDLDSNGNDEIIFLDQVGASVGGELRVFYWSNNKATEVNEEYYTNKITLKHYNKKHFILLWQHDTENLYFCTAILSFHNGKLINETTPLAWKDIITNYEKSADLEKSKWRQSRYYTYIALAYQKLNNKAKEDMFFDKARKLDPTNPFVNGK